MSNDKYIEPDEKHSALIIIDVQKDFTLKDAPAEISGTLQVVPKIQRIVNQHRKQKLPIFHVLRLSTGWI